MMILRVILYYCLLYHATGQRYIKTCLTGYMTDVQSWVDEEGVLKPTIAAQSSIDLSSMTNAVMMLQQQIMKFPQQNTVKYLSMARCRLVAVPNVFQFRDTSGRPLFMTVEYITMYGNEFLDIGSPGEQYDVVMNATGAKELTDGIGYGREVQTQWSLGFQNITFPMLQELDLRLCGIQVLVGNVFRGMSRLEALYLGENNIYYVNADAFSGLYNLIHLDLSRNNRFNENVNYKTLSFESMDSFVDMTNLTSLDFSFTKLSQNDLNVFRPLGSKFKRLSLCDSGLTRLRDSMFNNTSLKFLDISGNSDILSAQNTLGGLESVLQVLYADRIGLKNFEIFYSFKKLEILKLANNEIGSLTEWVFRSLTKLQILDLDKNRLSTWFNPLFTYVPTLKLLSLKENNINIISEEMIRDLRNVTYIALSKNFLVCNCYSREMLELAMKNEIGNQNVFINNIQNNWGVHDAAVYHTGFKDFNRIIANRISVSLECEITNSCSGDRNDLQVEGNFLLIDYELGEYQCLQMPEGKSISITKVKTCNQTQRDIDLEDYLNEGWNKLLALWIIPAVIFPILVFVFIFRRNFRYFFITMRNSAMLSLINKKDAIDDATIFNYDVFLSYCNEDRAWVLDHLLPHVEKDCNISVCLHERDFQVGLSILENIVSCMDRSRAIMLVISQRFLLSQWCQFEMHLAQHRLLETRREDLILILLEDIPRRLRPNTLHYLMLTKTYIVWPKEVAERNIFWKRLKKSLVAHKLKQSENISLA